MIFTMALKHALGKWGVGIIGGLAFALPLSAAEFDERVETVHSQIGVTESEQHASIVKILIGNRVPRPQMREVAEKVRQSENSFRYSFNELQDYFTEQVLPESFQDGAELKAWFKKNMMPRDEINNNNLYAQYGEIMIRLDKLKSILFTGTVDQITQSILELEGKKEEEDKGEVEPGEEDPVPDETEKVITLTGTIEEIQKALNVLTTPPVETPDPTPEEEEGDTTEPPVAGETLISRIERFMEGIDPGEGRDSNEGVYGTINEISNDSKQDSISVRYVSKHLFISLYDTAAKLRYELQQLPSKVNEISSTLTDQVFMDNILTRLSIVEGTVGQVVSFLSFREPSKA